MLFNNIPLHIAQFKVLFGIFERSARVVPAVQGSVFIGDVPVIKKIIMQQRPAHKLVFMPLEGFEAFCQPVAVICNGNAVQKAGGIPVLNKKAVFESRESAAAAVIILRKLLLLILRIISSDICIFNSRSVKFLLIYPNLLFFCAHPFALFPNNLLNVFLYYLSCVFSGIIVF